MTSIDYGAFACVPSLTTVYFESNSQLTSIARYAFLGCDLLTNITIPESVTHIGYGAFCLCSSLESINIPDGVTYISEALFQECRSLKSITIPNSVKEIDDIAFWKCTSLESIYFNGTLSEWYAIEKSHYHGWNGYSGNYTVYCTDGTTSRGYNS